MDKDCVIFIAAKDIYADTWDIFFSLFFKYWPDCPFPVYLVSENKTYFDPRIIPMVVPENPEKSWGEQWASRMKNALDKINSPYFIFLHTDYMFKEKVDTERILKLLKIAQNNNIGNIRLYPLPAPSKKWGVSEGEKLGLIEKSDDYSVSLQVALWNRGFFEKILKDGWSPVEMELIGSKEVALMSELLLSVFKNDPAISYINALKKGKWLYDAVSFIKKEGLYFKPILPVEGLSGYYMRVSGLGSFISKLKRVIFKKIMVRFRIF